MHLCFPLARVFQHTSVLDVEMSLTCYGRRARLSPRAMAPSTKRTKTNSTALSLQKGVKTISTKAGSIVDLVLSSIQLTRSDNLDHLDLAIAKESKWTESTYCAISGKAFGNQTVLTASVPQNL